MPKIPPQVLRVLTPSQLQQLHNLPKRQPQAFATWMNEVHAYHYSNHHVQNFQQQVQDVITHLTDKLIDAFLSDLDNQQPNQDTTRHLPLQLTPEDVTTYKPPIGPAAIPSKSQPQRHPNIGNIPRGFPSKPPGMPNMKVIMYVFPVMMIFFFNNYSSGLSYYYFISTLISILIMVLIKQLFVDEDKLKAKMAERKAAAVSNPKVKKKSKFQERLEQMQKMQQEQLKNRKK